MVIATYFEVNAEYRFRIDTRFDLLLRHNRFENLVQFFQIFLLLFLSFLGFIFLIERKREGEINMRLIVYFIDCILFFERSSKASIEELKLASSPWS